MSDRLPLLFGEPPPRKNSRRRRLPLLTVDAKRLAKMLSCGLRTIRSLDAAGRIPKPLRIGHSVRWSVSEIRDWLNAGAPSRGEWEARKVASRK